MFLLPKSLLLYMVKLIIGFCSFPFCFSFQPQKSLTAHLKYNLRKKSSIMLEYMYVYSKMFYQENAL